MRWNVIIIQFWWANVKSVCSCSFKNNTLFLFSKTKERIYNTSRCVCTKITARNRHTLSVFIRISTVATHFNHWHTYLTRVNADRYLFMSLSLYLCSVNVTELPRGQRTRYLLTHKHSHLHTHKHPCKLHSAFVNSH